MLAHLKILYSFYIPEGGGGGVIKRQNIFIFFNNSLVQVQLLSLQNYIKDIYIACKTDNINQLVVGVVPYNSLDEDCT